MNTDIYTCRHCGYTGPAYRTEVYEYQDSMYGRPPTRVAVERMICEDCGSENLEEAVLCDTCGRNPAAPHMDDCEECLEKQEAEQDALVDRIKELRTEIDEYLP
jgi:ribosomal protein L40E